MPFPLPDIDVGSWAEHQKKELERQISERMDSFGLGQAMSQRMDDLNQLAADVNPFDQPAPEPAPAPAPEPVPVPSPQPRAAPPTSAASTPTVESPEADPLTAWRQQTFQAGLSAAARAGADVQSFAGSLGQRLSGDIADKRDVWSGVVSAAAQAGADVQSFASAFQMPEPPMPEPPPSPTPSGGRTVAQAPGGGLRDAARQAAQQYGLNPDIFEAQIQQESGFRADAQSPAGARGVGQFMPATGAGVARQMGVSEAEFWNSPELQLQGAARHMADLKGQFGTDELALAAYNAGPGAVQKYGGVPPFKETQTYIQKIMGGLGDAAKGVVSGIQQGVRDISQFGDAELTSDEAYAACGPAAAVRFAQRFGRNPSLREAVDLAKSVGWTAQQGMAGLGSQKALMDKMGVETQLVSGPQWDKFAAEAQTGNPVTISTSAHYFYADGYNPDTGQFHVGRSGTDLRGGKEWMTRGEIESAAQRLGGGAVQGALLASNPTVEASTTARPSSPSLLDRIGGAFGKAVDTTQQRLDAALAEMEVGRQQMQSSITEKLGSLEEPSAAAGRLGRAITPGGAGLSFEEAGNLATGAQQFGAGFTSDLDKQAREWQQRKQELPWQRGAEAFARGDTLGGVLESAQGALATGPFDVMGMPSVGQATATGLERAGMPSPYREILGFGADILAPGGGEFVGPGKGIVRAAGREAAELGLEAAERAGPIAREFATSRLPAEAEAGFAMGLPTGGRAPIEPGARTPIGQGGLGTPPYALAEGTPEHGISTALRQAAQANPEGVARLSSEEMAALPGMPRPDAPPTRQGGENWQLGRPPALDDVRVAIDNGLDQARWYSDFAQNAERLVGRDNINEFRSLFGITSQQTAPTENLQYTLGLMQMAREFTEQGLEMTPANIGGWVKNHPRVTSLGNVGAWKMNTDQFKKVADLYNRGYVEVPSNAKISSYSQNILSALENRFDPNSTMDTWMAQLFNYRNPQPVASQDVAFRSMRAVTDHLAGELGIVPHQAQAAAWFSIKAAKDFADTAAAPPAFKALVRDYRAGGNTTLNQVIAAARDLNVYDTASLRGTWAEVAGDLGVKDQIAKLAPHLDKARPSAADNAFIQYPGSGKLPFAVTPELTASRRALAEAAAPVVRMELGDEGMSTLGYNPERAQFEAFDTIPHSVDASGGKVQVMVPGGNVDALQYIGAVVNKIGGSADMDIHIFRPESSAVAGWRAVAPDGGELPAATVAALRDALDASNVQSSVTRDGILRIHALPLAEPGYESAIADALASVGGVHLNELKGVAQRVQAADYEAIIERFRPRYGEGGRSGLQGAERGVGGFGAERLGTAARLSAGAAAQASPQLATQLGGAAAGGAAGYATTPEGADFQERLARTGLGAAAGFAGGAALGRVLDRPIAARAAAEAAGAVPPGAAPGSPLTADAQRLVDMADAGGVPTFISNSLRRIAEANGVTLTPDSTPNDIIDALRARTRGAAPPPVPEAARPGAWKPPSEAPPDLPTVRDVPGAEPIKLTPEEEVARLRLEDFPEDLRDDIQKAAENANYAREQRRGVISDAAAEQRADKWANDTSVDTVIKNGAAGRAYNTEQLRAIRNATAAQASKVDELVHAIDAGDDSTATLVRMHHEADRLQRLVQVGEGARAEWGRAGRAFQSPTRLIDMKPEDALAEITKLTGTNRTQLVERVREYKRLIEAGNGVIEMSNFWAGLKDPVTKTDWVKLIRYNSMLSGPRTMEVNFLGNLMEFPWRVGRDLAASTLRGRPGEIGPELAGIHAGMGQGYRAFMDTMFKGVTKEAAARGDLKASVSRRLEPGSAAAKTAGFLEIPGRISQGLDEWAQAIAYNMHVGREAALKASGEGLRGGAWNTRVSQILAEPTTAPEVMTRAREAAERLTFKGELGTFGTIAERAVAKSGLFGHLVLPFLRTTYHLGARGIERSPLGLLGTVTDVATGKYGPLTRQNLGEQLAGRGTRAKGLTPLGERTWDGLVGSAIVYTLYQQALEGNVSAAGPEERGDQDLLRSQGWQPYSIRVGVGGDNWVSYANWGPAAIPFAMAGAAAEAQRYAKPGHDAMELLLDGAARTAKVSTEMTYLKSIGAAYKGLTQPDIYGPTWVYQTVSSLIPLGSLGNTVAQAMDPLARRPERNQLLDNLQYRLPPGTPIIGGRDVVPEARDVLGRQQPNTAYGLGAVNPLRVSPVKDDAVLSELDLRGVTVPPPPKEVTRNGTPYRLTPDEQRDLQNLSGQRIAEFLATQIESEAYQNASEAAKVKRLHQVIEQVRARAQNEYLLSLSAEERTRRGEEGRERKAPVPVSGR